MRPGGRPASSSASGIPSGSPTESASTELGVPPRRRRGLSGTTTAAARSLQQPGRPPELARRLGRQFLSLRSPRSAAWQPGHPSLRRLTPSACRLGGEDDAGPGRPCSRRCSPARRTRPSRCSQLSSTSGSRRLPARGSPSASTSDQSDERSWAPSATNDRLRARSPGSWIRGQRRGPDAPSGKPRATSAAALTAQPRLADPPLPDERRAGVVVDSSRCTSCSSWRRPTKLVGSAPGRLWVRAFAAERVFTRPPPYTPAERPGIPARAQRRSAGLEYEHTGRWDASLARLEPSSTTVGDAGGTGRASRCLTRQERRAAGSPDAFAARLETARWPRSEGRLDHHQPALRPIARRPALHQEEARHALRSGEADHTTRSGNESDPGRSGGLVSMPLESGNAEGGRGSSSGT